MLLICPASAVPILCSRECALQLDFSDRSQREKALLMDTRTSSGKEAKHSVRSWSKSDHTHTPFSLRMHRPYLAIKRSIKLGTRKGEKRMRLRGERGEEGQAIPYIQRNVAYTIHDDDLL